MLGIHQYRLGINMVVIRRLTLTVINKHHATSVEGCVGAQKAYEARHLYGRGELGAD